jgi:uncharacterized protein (AIM24 family)
VTATTSTYICRYCRQPSDPSAPTCPLCGAPVDVKAAVSRSGWQKQPAIRDMARIQFGQSHLQIEGTQVPVADFNLAGNEWIYFSHHTLLWADPSAQLTAMGMRGGWKRMMAGMPLIMVQGAGPGHIALSDNHAGEILALPLAHGQRIWVREHRFLTATGNITYDWETSHIWFTTGSGDDRETHYPLGYIGDQFVAEHGPGLLLLHAPGNTFVRDLAPNETILIQPGALVYRDVSVQAHLHLEYPHGMGGFSMFRSTFSYRTVWIRLIGPERVAVQSVFERPENSEMITSSSFSTSQSW